MTKNLKVVDIFSGCGGLSLGFDLYNGNVSFETVMALDNWSSAIKCFNDNHKSNEIAPLKIGRVCDLNWFDHSTEVHLYYLIHLAYSKTDSALISKLEKLETLKFLNMLKLIDQSFESKLSKLLESENAKKDLKKIQNRVFALAQIKKFMTDLSISSFNKGTLKKDALIWSFEYQAILNEEKIEEDKLDKCDEILQWAKGKYKSELLKLKDSISKTGSGQHSVNSGLVKTLIEFLSSTTGIKFKNLWVDWISSRNSLRANFCIENEKILRKIYKQNKADVLLGGPPCKGFSRIGRAVIQNLRDQGVHSWSNNEFGDDRNALMYKYVLFLEALEPTIFLFENVAHFQSSLKTPNGVLNASELLEDLINEVNISGVNYSISSEVLLSKHYSVPQDRERYIMFGVKKDVGVESLNFFNFQKNSEYVDLKYCLEGLGKPGMFKFAGVGECDTSYISNAYDNFDNNMPKHILKFLKWIRQKDPKALSSNKKITSHIYRPLRNDDRELLKQTGAGVRWMDLKTKSSKTLREIESIFQTLTNLSKTRLKELGLDKEKVLDVISKVDDGLALRLYLENIEENKLPKDEENHLLKDSYLKRGSSKHGDWFERLSATKPCKTIVAHIGKDTYGYFHPYEDRAISIREAARVQSFPDYFKFSSTGVVDSYSIIGNAVPPLLSNMFAEQVDYLNIFDIDKDTQSNQAQINLSL